MCFLLGVVCVCAQASVFVCTPRKAVPHKNKKNVRRIFFCLGFVRVRYGHIGGVCAKSEGFFFVHIVSLSLSTLVWDVCDCVLIMLLY